MNAADLMNKLQKFYGQLYPVGQQSEIIKRFSSVTEGKLITLYDTLIATNERKPALSKMIECYERISRQPVQTIAGQMVASGRHPWEVDKLNAQKAAREYTKWAMENDLPWITARCEGWGITAEQFVMAWAEVQAQLINGAKNYGVDARTMLSAPWGADDYDSRLQTMKECNRQAKETGTIMVICPEWLKPYGMQMALLHARYKPVTGDIHVG